MLVITAVGVGVQKLVRSRQLQTVFGTGVSLWPLNCFGTTQLHRVMNEYDEDSDYEQIIHAALLHKHTQREEHPLTTPRYVLRDIGAPVTAVHMSDSCGELFIGTQRGLVAEYSLQSYRRVSAPHLPQQRASVMALEEDNRAWLYRYVYAVQ